MTGLSLVYTPAWKNALSSVSYFFDCNINVNVNNSVTRRRVTKKRMVCLVPNAKKEKEEELEWWERFFLDEQGNWFGWKDAYDELSREDDDDDHDHDYGGDDTESKFQAWKRRAEAISELREARQDSANQESRRWEDWLDHHHHHHQDDNDDAASDWEQSNSLVIDNQSFEESNDDNGDDDLLYEDRVFRYASINSFLAVLIAVPLALDFAVNEYALMPFLDRYVKTVPLAAQILDVRREQKLEIVDKLKLEQARIRLEVQIGKSPPLSDDQLWSETRRKAVELRDERRLENRRAFANVWSDMVFGLSLFVLLYANQNQVALLKFTGYKILNNVSDTGKAFLIILITDIFLGYHSESGWQTLVEIFVEHYGLQVDQSAITVFICLVPVIMDACVKLWMFKFLPRLSPRVANIFQEMKHH